MNQKFNSFTKKLLIIPAVACGALILGMERVNAATFFTIDNFDTPLLQFTSVNPAGTIPPSDNLIDSNTEFDLNPDDVVGGSRTVIQELFQSTVSNGSSAAIGGLTATPPPDGTGTGVFNVNNGSGNNSDVMLIYDDLEGVDLTGGGLFGAFSLDLLSTDLSVSFEIQVMDSNGEIGTGIISDLLPEDIGSSITLDFELFDNPIVDFSSIDVITLTTSGDVDHDLVVDNFLTVSTEVPEASTSIVTLLGIASLAFFSKAKSKK